jgi:2-polyprenyl-3-methyl-5-hydroxy-6-metoxy-1,4-benzoquinol methylase
VNINDIYRPILTYFRRRRVRALSAALQVKNITHVLDVGGSLFIWELMAKEGLPVPKVTIVNIYPEAQPLPEGVRWVVGDGRQLPFPTKSFDMVFSNSVIEHMGSMSEAARFAAEVRRVGRHYFVQTPNYGFPIEPHYLTPFVHWLPAGWRARIARNFTVWGWLARPSREEVEERIREILLLSREEVGRLFPDARVFRERLLGMTKSLIAMNWDEPDGHRN